MSPFGPESEASVWALPNWSTPDKGGTVAPTCGPSVAVTTGGAGCCAAAPAMAMLTMVTSTPAESTCFAFTRHSNSSCPPRHLLISFAPEDLMRRFTRTLAAAAITLVCVTSAGAAQAPSPAGQAAPAPNANIVVDNPTYLVIPLEIAIDRPAADVWKRVGKYCDIAEWLQIPAGCKMLSGIEGEVGSVRSVANEVLVGKTAFSYTYTQPVRAGRPYNLYHGTMEVRAVTATTSRLYYTLVYDNSMLPDEAARDKDKASRIATFTRAIQNIKTLAEGGTLPPR